jgi:hypothetical protein
VFSIPLPSNGAYSVTVFYALFESNSVLITTNDPTSVCSYPEERHWTLDGACDPVYRDVQEQATDCYIENWPDTDYSDRILTAFFSPTMLTLLHQVAVSTILLQTRLTLSEILGSSWKLKVHCINCFVKVHEKLLPWPHNSNTYPQTLLLAYFPKAGLCDLHHVSLCVPVHPPDQFLNIWTNIYETCYAHHGNWAHLSGVPHQSLPSPCVSVCVSLLSLKGNGWVKCVPPFIDKQRLGKHVSAAIMELLDAPFSMKHLSYQRRFRGSVYPAIVSRYHLGKDGLNQRSMIKGVVFYALRVVSKESRRLVLHRISCLNLTFKYNAS